ncbi:MAG: restriction endonuclease [Armatimonadetes bacterium]|nr:restriction endonuclease [Armatimonadota bacterium]
MSSSPREIALTEYQPQAVPRAELPEAVARRLVDNYGTKVVLETPPFENDWRLTARGWIGWLPLGPDLVLHLRPRVPLANLFGMLEYAYRLKGLEILPDVVPSGSLAEFFQSLARVLAARVIDRARRGLYRSYLDEQDALPYLRGRLDLSEALARPHRVRLPCHYEENTADLADNQILVWTLHAILLTGLCQEHTETLVRKAFHALRSSVTLRPFKPDECLQQLYNRLNSDYLPLHALCRFFLESSGPTHERGEHRMLPFLIDMAHLFELFVAEWLRAHAPPELHVEVQDSIRLGEERAFEFVIDISLYDRATGRCLAVLDTKYKVDDKPSNDDISQVVTYAVAKGSDCAILVYPQAVQYHSVGTVGPVRVYVLGYPIDGDLEAAGQVFLSQLLKLLGKS